MFSNAEVFFACFCMYCFIEYSSELFSCGENDLFRNLLGKSVAKYSMKI